MTPNDVAQTGVQNESLQQHFGSNVHQHKERLNPWSQDYENVQIVINHLALSSNERENMIHSANSSCQSSGSPDPAIGTHLTRTVRRWCEATGLPTSVTVLMEDRTFKLHKYPLVSRSGYMKRELSESLEITLPNSCPGGPEIFELVVNFCYGSAILMDPFNVAALRCAAEFLEMAQEFGRGNLCERSDLYLTQVVLQSWEDTLIVLQTCQCLLPLAEELLIVSRCIESLAFMACMEVLDPEHRRTRPGVPSPHQCQFWSDISESLRDATAKDWWIKDLLALPFHLFERIIASIRKQGMEEKFLSPVIVMYANKWILSSKSYQISNDEAQKDGSLDAEKSALLEGVIRLLPAVGRKSNMIPVRFLFSLLSQALNCGSSNESKAQLQIRIASQLELATIEDFLLPKYAEYNNNGITVTSSPEVECMRSIVSIFIISQQSIGNTSDDSHDLIMGSRERNQSSRSYYTSKNAVSTVANLWDEYIAQIAIDATLSPIKFSELVEIIPSAVRCTHDLLYKAIDTYLMAHPHISQQERHSVCKFLSCQKLSQETCIRAVQNELMPLRLIVQAMFMQQQHTRQVVQYSTANSMRFEYNSSTLMDSRFLQEDLLQSRADRDDHIQDEFLPNADPGLAFGETAADFEATSFRLKNLEQELTCMKKNLEEINKDGHANRRHIFSGIKSESFRLFLRDKLHVNHGTRSRKNREISTCIGTNWQLSHTNLAHKILKTFQRLGRIGFTKSKHAET